MGNTDFNSITVAYTNSVEDFFKNNYLKEAAEFFGTEVEDFNPNEYEFTDFIDEEYPLEGNDEDIIFGLPGKKSIDVNLNTTDNCGILVLTVTGCKLHTLYNETLVCFEKFLNNLFEQEHASLILINYSNGDFPFKSWKKLNYGGGTLYYKRDVDL